MVYVKLSFEAANKYGQFVRSRSQGQRYDRIPSDITTADLSQLEALVNPKRQRQPQERGR
jgi:hypothetical protein